MRAAWNCGCIANCNWPSAEAVGRNPGAFGKVLTIGIIAMALSEAVAIYALIMAFQKY